MRHLAFRLALLTAACHPVSSLAQQVVRAEAPVPGVRDPLADGLDTPPESARPRVWWHWLSGNVSQDGITKDFE